MKKLIYLFLVSGLISCSESTKESDNKQEPVTQDSVSTNTQEAPLSRQILVPVDWVHQQTALFLAGLPQEDSCYFSQFENTEWWKAHAREMESIWSKAEELRLGQLKEWQESELSRLINDTLPLFYPYSGPDFLHAYFFYPNANGYHMMAMEPVVMFPEWSKLSETEMKNYLTRIRNSLRDVVGKSYFITQHMMADIKEEELGGVLPVFSIFLARTGHSILNIEPIILDSNGVQTPVDEGYYGLKFSITKDGHIPKTLSYMKYDLSDKNLSKHPEFMTWVNSLGTKNAFVKAASYLMHYKGFGISREATQVNTHSVFQDDTGLPLKYVDMSQWNLKLYGAYTRPIKNFTDQMIQNDLKQLYEDTPDSLIGTIPFPLGYHVVGDHIQNHQLFIRK